MPRRYDDDDDDDREERDRPIRRAPESGGSIAVKILAILGSVLMVLVLVCGGLAYYVISSVKQGVKHVQANLSEAIEQQKEQIECDQQRMREQMEEDQKKCRSNV